MTTTAPPSTTVLLRSVLHCNVIVVKLVLPIAVLGEVANYYGLIEVLAAMFGPVTAILDLPASTAIVLAAGVLLNLYAGIALAAALALEPDQWTVIAVFLAICHSLPLEAAVLSKVGFSKGVHVLVRLVLAIFFAWCASFYLGIGQGSIGGVKADDIQKAQLDIDQVLIMALSSGLILTAKVCVLITIILVSYEWLKATTFKKLIDVAPHAGSLTVGLLMGITYGAGIVIHESNKLTAGQRNLVARILLVCHGLVEETLIFVMLGADWALILLSRLAAAAISVVCGICFDRMKAGEGGRHEKSSHHRS